MVETIGYGILVGTALMGIVEAQTGLEGKVKIVGGNCMKKGISYPTLNEFTDALQKTAQNYPGAIVEPIL